MGLIWDVFVEAEMALILKKKKEETQSINQIIEVNVLGHIGGKERGYNSQQ